MEDTTVQLGTGFCPSKRIPEDTLLDTTSEILKEDILSEGIFSLLIDHIEAADGNRLIYICRDGQTIQATWRDRSRSESWTDEMKQAAREKSLAIKEIQKGGSDSKTGNEN